jgi:microcystin-dependent protein
VGLAALVNAQATGSVGVLVTQVGLASAPFTVASTLTALPNEIKRLTTFGGAAVDPATIHISIRDDSAGAFDLFGFGLYLNNGTLLAVYSQPTRILGKAAISQALISLDVRLASAVAADIHFGATAFLDPPATTERAGLVELATPAETVSGADAQRAVTPAGLKAKTDVVTAEARTYADIKKAEAIAAAATDATSKADAAQAAAIGAAATDANTKDAAGLAAAKSYADTKKAEAIAAAATDATNKANAAHAAAIGAAATDANTKDAANLAAAKTYADTKKAEAIAAAATDATNKANAAQAAAIGAAATDAQGRASAAQAAAQTYADTKKAEALSQAATDAQGRANAAQAAAIGAAATDAQNRANTAQTNAYNAATQWSSTDAQNKANTAQNNAYGAAINYSASDAQGRANAAQAAAEANVWQAGDIKYRAHGNVPAGWVECNGQELNRAVDAALFAAIGTMYGGGNGSTTFNVPDYRGEFLRVWDHGRGADPGRDLGSWQDSQNLAHVHTFAPVPRQGTGGGYSGVNGVNGTISQTDASGGTESRPRNVSVMALIKR